MSTAEVWVLAPSRTILVTTYPGPPQSICCIDANKAKARGYVAIGDISFSKEAYLGEFPLPEWGGWGKAGAVAQAKAKELGYTVEYADAFAVRYAEDWD